VREDFELPLDRPAAVAAHRRKDEGRGAEVAQVVHHGPDDHRDVGDAAAARPDGHPVAPANRQGGPRHGRPHRARNVRDALARQLLPHPDHPRRRHGGKGQ
jgi:hypothetical protein